MSKRARWSLASAVFFGVMGCGGAQRPKPTPCTLPVEVELRAGDRINLDTQGEALPTVIRLFQLSDIVSVEEADFAQLWEQPEETLGDDLVQMQEVTLFPGQTQTVASELKPETRYLVGMGVFRRPTGTQWRSILPLPSSEQLCGAYKEPGAPSPAVVFTFDNYRAEGRSRLLSAAGEHELPEDVAPDAPSSGAEKPAD